LTTRSPPSSFFNRSEPRALRDAVILTDGRPRSVISRKSTVSAEISPLFCGLAGSTLMLARTRPCSSTISSAGSSWRSSFASL